MFKNFTKNDLTNLIDDSNREIANPVDIDYWRWGTVQTFIFKDGEELYRAIIHVHSEDGWEDFNDLECERVVPMEVKITQYVPWKP